MPTRSPGRQGGREEGHRLSDPLRWMGEGHRGTWEASSDGPRRGLRRGVGGGGGPTHPRTSWVLYLDPETQATNKSVSLHGSGSPVYCAAGGKGSGHQGGRGWAPSHHPISFCNTSLAVAGPPHLPRSLAGILWPLPKRECEAPLGEWPSRPEATGSDVRRGGVDDPEASGFWPVLRLGIWPSQAPLLPVAWTSRPCLRHHVPRTAHFTHDSTIKAAALDSPRGKA